MTFNVCFPQNINTQHPGGSVHAIKKIICIILKLDGFIFYTSKKKSHVERLSPQAFGANPSEIS